MLSKKLFILSFCSLLFSFNAFALDLTYEEKSDYCEVLSNYVFKVSEKRHYSALPASRFVKEIVPVLVETLDKELVSKGFEPTTEENFGYINSIIIKVVFENPQQNNGNVIFRVASYNRDTFFNFCVNTYLADENGN